jgi:hypothetical protein
VARQCAITLCWDYAGLSHSELANLFGLRSSGAQFAHALRGWESSG